jgi:hypothetical protein
MAINRLVVLLLKDILRINHSSFTDVLQNHLALAVRHDVKDLRNCVLQDYRISVFVLNLLYLL